MAGDFLNCGGRQLDLRRCQVMGVLNVTPDSFSDGGALYDGRSLSLDKILYRAEQMVAQGARLIDIGGESTRPGASPVSVTEELERVLPAVEAISQRLDVIISVDTSSPEVMLSAAASGAGLINDVRSLTRPGALSTAAATGLPVCLMHMQGEPGVMQQNPHYENVVLEVGEFLQRRAQACIAEGVAAGNILLDPGFGFGKSVAHNLALLNRLPELVALGYPVLVGLSRKSLLGKILGRELNERLAGSLALAVLAAERGAAIIRAHDITETVDALRLCQAVACESEEGV